MKSYLVIAMCLCAGLAGCQSYEPLTLDLDEHAAGWAARSPGDERVRAYADALAELNPAEDVAFDPSDGLTLGEAELVALVFNPKLRLARLKAKAPLLGAQEAGRWDDPQFDFDLLRITEGVDDPWIVGSSLTLTIPISGRLSVERDKAFAEADVALRRALLDEWMLLSELRAAWATWTAATQRIVLIEDYLKALDDVLVLAKKQREASRIGAPQYRILELEKVTRVGELNTLRIEAYRRRLALHALMGLTPEAPVELAPALAAELRDPDSKAYRDQLRAHNLQLAVARAEYDVADHALRLEIRKQYPDLVIGPGYENEDGISRAGVVLSIPIPLLNQNRRGIAETRATRDATKAAYEAAFETLIGELAQAEASVEAAKARSRYLQDTVAPMVDAQMKDLRRLAELGDLDVLVILDALTRTLETKEQVLHAKVEEAIAVNALHTLLRPLKTPQPEAEE